MLPLSLLARGKAHVQYRKIVALSIRAAASRHPETHALVKGARRRILFIDIDRIDTPTPDGHAHEPAPETAPEFSAMAWHYAKQMADVLEVPVGIVSAAYGGARVESWTPRDMLEKYPDVSLDPKDVEPMVHYLRPLLMYNAMFNPVKQYTYKGIIWYQGCSNVSTYETYAERLAAMVTRWRDEIGLGDIPFYAVEIAPYEYDSPAETGKSPYLREAQWKAVS